MARRGKDLARKMSEVVEHAKAQGWMAEVRPGGHWKMTPPTLCARTNRGVRGVVFVSRTPSDWRAVKNNISMMRRYGFDPNCKARRTHARLHEAEDKLAKAVGADPVEALHLYLDAITLSAVALHEAEHGKSAKSEVAVIERGANRVADKAREGLRQMVTSKNPANIPGGSMGACIEIMGRRPDVESPGALCNWMAQRAGEPRGAGAMTRLFRKMDPAKDSRAILRKLTRSI